MDGSVMCMFPKRFGWFPEESGQAEKPIALSGIPECT